MAIDVQDRFGWQERWGFVKANKIKGKFEKLVSLLPEHRNRKNVEAFRAMPLWKSISGSAVVDESGAFRCIRAEIFWTGHVNAANNNEDLVPPVAIPWIDLFTKRSRTNIAVGYPYGVPDRTRVPPPLSIGVASSRRTDRKVWSRGRNCIANADDAGMIDPINPAATWNRGKLGKKLHDNIVQ